MNTKLEVWQAPEMLPKRLGRHIESENIRRFLKGLSLPDILKGDEDEESDAAETAQAEPETEAEADENALAANDAAAELDIETENEAEVETEEEDDEGDFLLEESARVLADYISLSERQISAVSDF